MTEIHWTWKGQPRAWVWRSDTVPPPGRVGAADDRTTADAALRRLRSGEALVYAGDYHNARQLLAALGRRLARAARAPRGAPSDIFRAERQQRLLEHEVLSRLLVPVEGDLRLPLGRAPDLADALAEAWGPPDGRASLAPLRELLGMVGAHEWRRKGVEVPALDGRVHPHYGVFAPIRGEYVDLVAAELATRDLAGRTAFDVGTGTGVLAILAARRGARVVATDLDPRAVACARENAARFAVADRVEVIAADLFPAGEADLVLCNPPWLPERPATPLDRAVFDPGGAFLARFVEGLPARLAPGGEALLVLSDLAELLALRPRGHLREAFARAGLAVRRTREARAAHPRARDAEDPLHAVRSREVTTLYVLASAASPS